METIKNNYTHIKGWGIDANPENDPAYPMKDRTNAEHTGYSWKRPTQQPINVEILHSNERPNVTAVFGTSTPPSGLSGMIRRFAFRYSESSYGHWLPLIFADRVNVVEGIIDDLAHGHVPNIFAEKGYNAEWKFNKKGMIVRAAIGLAIVGGIVALSCMKNKSKKNRLH